MFLEIYLIYKNRILEMRNGILSERIMKKEYVIQKKKSISKKKALKKK